MADIVSKEVRSRMMSNIRAKNTALEILVRKHLHKSGFRFRLQKAGEHRQILFFQSEHVYFRMVVTGIVTQTADEQLLQRRELVLESKFKQMWKTFEISKNSDGWVGSLE